MNKQGIEIYRSYLNTKGQYELWLVDNTYKKGDIITADLCIFKNDHTYIEGTVLKSYKHKIVIKYRYL